MRVPAALRGASVAGVFPIYGLMGAMQALYGPLLPAFRATFHVTPASAGLLFSAHFCGAAVGILIPGALARGRGHDRWLVGGATGGLALGYLSLGVAPTWPSALAAAALIGLAYGCLVRVCTALVVTRAGARNAFMLLLLNAIFGCGALAGPALLGLIAPTSFRGPFVGGAVLMAALLPLVLTLPPPQRGPRRRPTGASRPRWSAPLMGFIVLFFVLGGMEASLGGWEATQFVAHGVSLAAAATFSALFWGMLTLGRILLAPLTLRYPAQRIVLTALLSFVLLATLAHVAALTPLCYTLAGFCLAPLYPLSLIWFDQARLTPDGAPTWVMVSDLLGGSAVPSLVGLLMTLTTVDSLASALSGCAVAACALALALRHGLAAPATAPSSVP